MERYNSIIPRILASIIILLFVVSGILYTQDSSVIAKLAINDTSQAQEQELGKTTVFVTKTGSKYHSDGCRYLSRSKIPISLENAVKTYSPCSVCLPPTLFLKKKPISKEKEITVYVTRTGAKYHRSGCRYLKKSMIPISLKNAKKRYNPCSVCRPPS